MILRALVIIPGLGLRAGLGGGGRLDIVVSLNEEQIQRYKQSKTIIDVQG